MDRLSPELIPELNSPLIPELFGPQSGDPDSEAVKIEIHQIDTK
jgi:hypothetical protein